MQLTLSDEDARGLREFLHDHFHELQLETARTEQREFRHALVERQGVIERVLGQLDRLEAARKVDGRV